ncbi:MAG: alkaline phosphatase D family protein [Pseudomonadota bacterium]|nr:alkaline phosphatase D family protein [Pseudomonadota bacterium]
MKDKFYLVLFVFFSNFLISDEIKIGIGSCLDQDFPQPIWQPIEEENLDYFIFLGDNVYGDSIFENLYKMKRAYSKQEKLLPDFLDQTDIFAIWDDHDYGKNDGGSDYKYKKLAENLFLDFWNVPINDVRRSREGIYFSENKVFFNKKYKLIFLDTRYFRSELKGKKGSYQKNNDESSTILGKEQWTWLEKELNSNFDYLFIFSSIQIIPEDHGFEKWSNFPNDRTKLLKILEKYKDRTILFSGDRHRSGIYKRNGIIEITSSSMNKPGSSFFETDKYLIGETYPQENYSVLKILNDDINIDIKDKHGEILNSISLKN